MTHKKLPLTVCMVIYNEEAVIERALLSCADLADEVLVVHDGACSDNSLAICKQYGARIVVREHVGIAEPHRAWMYGEAKNDWILQLDADEFLSEELRAALPTLICADDVACYALVWPNWDGKKYVTTGWPHKKALFRRDKIEFLALPHCEVIPTQGKVEQVTYVLEHRPCYDNVTIKTFRTKWMKWLKIHASYLLKNPATYHRYPADARIQTPRYYMIVSHPYLFALPLGLYQAWQALISGGYRAGIRGLKTSLFIGMYYVCMAIEVGRLEAVVNML